MTGKQIEKRRCKLNATFELHTIETNSTKYTKEVDDYYFTDDNSKFTYVINPLDDNCSTLDIFGTIFFHDLLKNNQIVSYILQVSLVLVGNLFTMYKALKKLTSNEQNIKTVLFYL